MSLSLLESLPAELHQIIFDHVLISGASLTFNPCNLLVSKIYYSRAQRSFYQHGNVKLSGTSTGLAYFKSIPIEMRRLITSLTFTGGGIQLQVLATVVADCPKITTLRLENLMPEYWVGKCVPSLGDRSLRNMDLWWRLTHHIPNLTVSKIHIRLRIYMKTRRILQDHPDWGMAQWGKIGCELGLWAGLSGVEDPDEWYEYFEVLILMYRLEVESAGRRAETDVGVCTLDNLQKIARDIMRYEAESIQWDGEVVERDYWTSRDIVSYRSRVGKRLCGYRGALRLYGGVRVNGEWTFPD